MWTGRLTPRSSSAARGTASTVPGNISAWARRVAAVSNLVNPLPVIEWDFDKVHHKELAAAGVPIVPTTWVDPASRWAPPAEADFVVKPSVSAGGRDTAHYGAGDPRALDHVRRLQALGHTVMVQDYVSRVDDEGETDLVFFDGVFSHAVVKRLVLKRGEGVIDRPWERMSWAGLVMPSPAQLAVAAQTVAFVVDQLGYQLPYGRIDLVTGPEGNPLVLEVELIDPYLSLDIEPLAAGRFAEALVTLSNGAARRVLRRRGKDLTGIARPTTRGVHHRGGIPSLQGSPRRDHGPPGPGSCGAGGLWADGVAELRRCDRESTKWGGDTGS